MKQNIVLTILLLLIAFTFAACAPISPDSQISDDISSTENRISTPAFLQETGETLHTLKAAYPKGEFTVNLDGFPDSASACFGEPGADYLYFFFGGHDGDFEKAMNECEEQLKCAGVITTAAVLFPEMKEEMSFEEFFTLIGVKDYTYFTGEDVITAEGWLCFQYCGMEVMLNTNEAAADTKIVNRNAPVSIVNLKISAANQDLADAVMFD